MIIFSISDKHNSVSIGIQETILNFCMLRKLLLTKKVKVAYTKKPNL